jgi:3-deoxy-D-manno-octulosonic acid kinase
LGGLALVDGLMQERTRNAAATAIVFDAARFEHITPDWFVPAYWEARDALHYLSGGRGGVAAIATPAGECILRHYHRGGLVARLLADRYLWQGAARTRSFAEFRLLQQIARLGLPGPVPIAARHVRQGAWYTADLITLRIPQARTFSEVLAGGAVDATVAGQVGGVVARFHRAGVWHADLNAHNILLNAEGAHVIDFDRGRLRTPHAAWRQANLRRLQRSLLKLGAASDGEPAFEATIWQPLLAGYRQAWAA